MRAGIVPVSQSLSLRVALIVQGIDVEFGDIATKAPYQRFDIFDADARRVDDVLKNFPMVRVGRSKGKVKMADPSLLKRPELRSSKELDD
ncbi:hypothetical protein KNV00_gp044 [Streptomyces phage Bmoc]|uniref:Uncharacterized protein n=1 Tax=Streptomyces phage Bmoc TaxID=2725629 RepID=A0A6M3T9E9_9CAUD|nr:hypothetical protein KNV00_gp011 [Streptomyces phage Bmoc]YP_010107626.1 hypothetical protein KNV00_gp044 [Streptomyces phage Bmoc]QJD50761.1 hypothetical protein SEA_BMOC_11 [Streptomyces phage Bmoc]QJD50975.1 hypothetical protein SEA_BMOC_267 [Streptomyces phage Bmoc]